MVLAQVMTQLQKNIDRVLGLEAVVLNAFIRDKVILVDFFQKIERVEMDFLVKSGWGFGFISGQGQIMAQ